MALYGGPKYGSTRYGFMPAVYPDVPGDTVPKGTNWIKDPSFESGVTSFWAATNGSFSTSSAPATIPPRSGVRVGRITISSVASEPVFYTPSAHRPVVVAGDLVNIRGWVAADSANVGKRIYMALGFYNIGGTLIGSLVTSDVLTIAATAHGWNAITLLNVIAPVGAVSVEVSYRMQIGGAAPVWAISDLARFDTIELRRNEPLDTYIDGDQGAIYKWTGVTRQSASIRLADPVATISGKGGLIRSYCTVFKSSAFGQVYEELSDYVTGGVISTDIDRDIKSTLELELTDVTKFPPYSWVSVYRTIEREGEEPETLRQGVFRLGQPTSEWPSGKGKVTGSDATIQVRDTVTTDTVTLAAGVVYTTAIESLLSLAGFTNRFAIPAAAATIPTGGLTYPRGTSYLAIVNELLGAIGYYTLYMTGDGILTSKPYGSRVIEDPRYTFTLGKTAELVGTITSSPSDSNLYNYVQAAYTKPNGTTIIRTAENKNAKHPYSTVALGQLAAPGGSQKVYQVKAIEANGVVDSTALAALAAEVLERSSMYRYVSVQTLPDGNHQPHEIVLLDFEGYDGMDELSGLYYVESYSLGLVGSASACTLRARRIEKTDG